MVLRQRPRTTVLSSGKPNWTIHANEKMRYYKLSRTRVLKVLRRPVRIEAGVAPRTIALMQPATPAHTSEIWLMYQRATRTGQITIITAWRYPGKSPTRNPIPIPEDIRRQLHI